MDLTAFAVNSSVTWILTGIFLCGCWALVCNILTEIASKARPPAQSNRAGANSPYEDPSLPKKIPNELLQRIRNGDVKPLPSRRFTRSELSVHYGNTNRSNPRETIYFSVKGLVYDVSSARGFYGPGGPYAAFAGCDATIALAKSNMEAVIGPKDQILGVESLTEYEVEQLKAWETKLQRKYSVIGYLTD